MIVHSLGYGLVMEDRNRDLSLYGGKDPRHMPIYTLDEAARILWLAPSTLKSWTMGQEWHDPSGKPRQFVPLIIPPESDEPMLSFTNLIEAHVLALEYLSAGSKSRVFNCGYGHGYSVKEVVEKVKQVTGVDFKVNETARRAGDPPSLIADSLRIRNELGWKPAHDDLEFIIQTAWDWEQKLNST